MSQRKPTTIRAWRAQRGLTLRQLAARINAGRSAPLISYASLGRIECGNQPYSQDTLEAIAEALAVEPFILLLRDDPPDSEQLACLWAQLSGAQRQLVLTVIRAIISTASALAH